MLRTLRPLAAALVLAVLLVPSDGAAQETVTRGLWWSAGVGAGGARVTCDLCAASRDVGPAARVSLGATARPGLRVGLTGGLWTHDDGDVRENVWSAGLVAQQRLRPGSRIHLDGGLGWAGYRADAFRYDAVELTLGVGYDIPVTGAWVVTNGLAIGVSSFGRLKRDERVAARDVSLSVVRFELTVGRR